LILKPPANISSTLNTYTLFTTVRILTVDYMAIYATIVSIALIMPSVKFETK